ncbi:Superoxide dismutase family protein OS=Streptomyces microflavus OX=1919 GN=G3I39_35270 PE=3 SV=1 [Streptomyces microflavus]
MTAQVDGSAAGAAGVAEAAGAESGRESRVPGTVRRRVLVGAVALVMLAGGVSIAHGAADGTDGAPAPDSGGHAAHDAGKAGGTGKVSGDGKAAGTREAPLVGGASRSGGLWMRADGVFSPPGSFVPSDALTYDTGLVPAAARIEVTQYADRTSHRVTTRLRGLVPNRGYGMHVHTAPCGADPVSAGPHYQHRTGHRGPGQRGVAGLPHRRERGRRGGGPARLGVPGRRRPVGDRSPRRAGRRGSGVACFTVPFAP